MQHLDLRYQQELNDLRTVYQEMLLLAHGMVQDAMRSVIERDPALGRAVVNVDRSLDQLELRADESCLRILALYRPVAGDLRLVATVMKSVTDIERIGDLAVNIAKRGFDLSRGAGLEPLPELGSMAEVIAEMLPLVKQGFLSRDPSVLTAHKDADERVDRMNREVLSQVILALANHPDQSRRGLALTSISKALERVADHAVNLGEQIVFMVGGTDVRHGGVKG